MSAIYHKTEYRERRNHYAVHAVSTAASGFDTSRESFIGTYGSPAMPKAVKEVHLIILLQADGHLLDLSESIST